MVRAQALAYRGLSFAVPAAPGLAAAAATTAAALLLSRFTPLPASFLAIVAGISASPWTNGPRFHPGLQMASRPLLRLGIALLGAKVSLTAIAALGWSTAAVTVGALALALAGGYGLARLLGLTRGDAAVTAAAVSICGASAALAVSALLPKTAGARVATATVVAIVTLAGTAGMLLYPLIARGIGYGDQQAGILLGGTLHELAQAVGAGYGVSVEAGDTATAVKLLRVACLAPVLLLAPQLLRSSDPAAARGARPPLAPPFLIGFVVLAVINGLGFIPKEVGDLAATASRWLLLLALAAIGARTSVGEMISDGPRPLVAILAQTTLLLGLVLGGMALAQVF